MHSVPKSGKVAYTAVNNRNQIWHFGINPPPWPPTVRMYQLTLCKYSQEATMITALPGGFFKVTFDLFGFSQT